LFKSLVQESWKTLERGQNALNKCIRQRNMYSLTRRGSRRRGRGRGCGRVGGRVGGRGRRFLCWLLCWRCGRRPRRLVEDAPSVEQRQLAVVTKCDHAPAREVLGPAHWARHTQTRLGLAPKPSRSSKKWCHLSPSLSCKFFTGWPVTFSLKGLVGWIPYIEWMVCP